MNIERARIALELMRIAAEISPEEELDMIDGMNVSQLIDTIRRHKSDLVAVPRRMKMKKFDDRLDMNVPFRNMTVHDMLKAVAKLGIDLDDEEEQQ